MSDYQLLITKFRELDKVVLSNYIESNKDVITLTDNFNLDSEIVLGEESDYSGKLFNQMAAFSNVGFNSDMNQALVYLETINNQRTGAGQFVLLFKENDEWKVRETFAAWME